MKKISVFVTGFLCFLSVINAFGQDTAKTKASFIQPYHLDITFNKTTNLVFPYAITSVDRGSRDILVQKAIGVENVLQVKAAKMDFQQTDLTVLTADGSLYAYVLDYCDSPANLNYVFNSQGLSWKPVAVFAKDATTDEIKKKSELVANKERTVDNLKDESFSVSLDVKGIYIHGEVVYFQLLLRNNSTINYDIQSLRFFICDQKRIKRTAEQEVDMLPLYLCGNAAEIPSLSEQTVTVALPKFTIPDKKFLAVQLMEKNGGRHLSLKIKNKILVRAKPI